MYTNELSPEDYLNSLMQEDEKLIQIVYPKAKVIYTLRDIPITIFGIVWTAFVCLFMYIFSTVNSEIPLFIIIKLFFYLWLSVFLLVGIYLLGGRNFINYIFLKNTIYAVTDKRIIIARKNLGKGYSCKSVYLSEINVLEITQNANNIGTITYKKEQYYHKGGYHYRYSQLINIYNVSEVHKLIYDLVFKEGKI